MRSFLLLPLLSSYALASFLPLSRQSSQKPITLGDKPGEVPGENPVKYCDGHPASTDILTIDYVDLSPNPPEKGQILKIEASGTISEVIEEGAFADIVVKYGYIKLLQTKADICEQIKNVDMECPLQPGKIKIIKEVELPKEIPPGNYKVDADVFTKDKQQITCLEADVHFS